MTAELDQLVETLEAMANRKKFHKLAYYSPYPKQAEFHALGATKRERLLRAGNQFGKTYAGAAETAYHLTGDYPKDWKGRKFPRPVNGWVAGEGAVLTRDGPQTLLCGPPGVDADFGSGLIPKDRFKDRPSLSRGVTDAYDTIQVEHRTNGVVDGVSTLSFKSYDQGRTKFQTKTLDFMWCDEEPPEDIYTECLARIASVPDGFVFITFTPLKGRSEVVMKFMDGSSIYRSDTVMTAWDIPGMTQARYDQMMSGYPKWQEQTRMMGVPAMGEGAVFPLDPGSITENDIPFAQIPSEWAKIWGLDFGIDHPFAAALIAWDKDADCIHVISAIRMPDALPVQHAAAIKPVGGNILCAWPQDGTQRRDDGKPLSDHYRRQGLRMMPEHARWPDGSNSTEAGILEMHERMTSARFKVARSLMNGAWGDEFRNYHREDGQIVKKMDDLMSATRVAVMQKRAAIVGPILGTSGYGQNRKKDQKPMADNIDFDLFGG